MNTFKNKIPSVKVKKVSLKENVRFITGLLNPEFKQKNTSLPFEERVYGLLPELREKIHKTMTSEERQQQIQAVLEVKFLKEEAKIAKRVIELQQLFDEMMPGAIATMLQVFEMEWPEDEKDIVCYIGYYPVFPRDMMTKEYWVNYSTIDERIIKGSIHEINHFVMFEKWKLMHGYSKKEEPTHPEALWFLQEIIVDPTLNEEVMQKVAPYPQEAYPQFYTAMIEGRSVMEHIKAVYEEKESMADFLDRAYQFVESHHSEIIVKCG